MQQPKRGIVRIDDSMGSPLGNERRGWKSHMDGGEA
jgi:hypothetical protein